LNQEEYRLYCEADRLFTAEARVRSQETPFENLSFLCIDIIINIKVDILYTGLRVPGGSGYQSFYRVGT